MSVRTLLVALLGCAAVTACGSTRAPSGTVTNGANASARGNDPGLAFAKCMRAHGVSNFPDPTPGRGIEIAPGSGLNPQSPAFQRAQSACRKYLPNKGEPPVTSAADRQRAVAFAKCMRTHGEPDFPDPLLSPPTGATRVLALHGLVFAVGPRLDPRSPAFRAAASQCGIALPGGK